MEIAVNLTFVVGFPDRHERHQLEFDERGSFCAFCADTLSLHRKHAFHDDVHAVAQHKRIVAVHRILGEELWQHSRIRINAGRTEIWNRGGHVPSGYETFLNEARAINPHAKVWFGRSDRPPEKNGIRILGTLLGTAEYVRSQLDATQAAHKLLLQRIPAVQDLQ